MKIFAKDCSVPGRYRKNGQVIAPAAGARGRRRYAKRRLKEAGLPAHYSPHSFRTTGITNFLINDGRLEHAQQMAGHESPRTTKLYDRTKDEITLSEVERIRL
jgi:site-specific recombinase XerD